LHEAARLARIPGSTFRRWVSRGIVRPSTTGLDDGGQPQPSFALADVVLASLVRNASPGTTLAARVAAAAEQLATIPETELRESLIPANFRTTIEIDPGKLDGTPVLTGTRFPTALFRDISDTSEGRLSDEFPSLSKEQTRAAVDFERFLDEAAC
jgi:uncharacterized protein (DUF433 family)